MKRSFVTALLLLSIASPGITQSAQSDEASQGRPVVIPDDPVVEDAEFEPVKILLDEIAVLREQMFHLRQELADARMQATQAQRELDEMKQFLADHHQFGEDFQQYRAVKDAAERDARRKEAEEARQRRDAEKAERQARMAAAREIKAQRDAENSRLTRYRQQGFSPVGLDVYVGKMGFFYNTDDNGSQVRIDYDWRIGRYLRPIDTGMTIDYSQMTISGSVLNGAEVTRNVGVAITFFDANGNQIGHETVRINNARPDVPYPFTSKISMASNREFDSSSVFVLYADAIDEEEPAPTSTDATGAPEVSYQRK